MNTRSGEKRATLCSVDMRASRRPSHWRRFDSRIESTVWPMQRGFDAFFGTIIGAGSFYDPNTLTRGNENVEHEARRPGWFYTDAISDQAVAYIDEHCRDTNGKPFFAYVAYTAP